MKQTKSKKHEPERKRPRQLLVACLMFGIIGTISLHFTHASTPDPNPPFQESCHNGLDVALLVDTSGSMQGAPLIQAESGIYNFIQALKDQPMEYAVGTIDRPQDVTFTADSAQALKVLEGPLNGGNSNVGNLRQILVKDPRPQNQNLIILFTDGDVGADVTESGILTSTAVEQKGTRVLAIGFGDIHLPMLEEIAGPNVNTGSIKTSDVITTNSSALPAQLAAIAKQLCTDLPTLPPGKGTGSGSGTGGTGTGTGGTGTGTSGTGTGTTGTGTGKSASTSGGTPAGSSATSAGDTNKQAPTTSSQGKSTKPKEQTPSPFFDGKQYNTGSDTDTVTPSATTSSGAHKWPYIAVAVVLLAGGLLIVGWHFRILRLGQKNKRASRV